MADEVKGCPFCGERGENLTIRQYGGIPKTGVRFEVVCRHCFATGPAAYNWIGEISASRELAIALWNTRHTEQPTDGA